MIYPGLLATVGTVSIIFLLTFVIPRFASVFENSDADAAPAKIMLETA
ncbi:MAG: hypothetical protein WKF37_16715 [Bryobacteraceae bacterium]